MPEKNSRKMPHDEKTKKQFFELCRIQCTEEEIAGVFLVSVSTLQRWCREVYGEPFAQIYKKMSAGGRASLRRFQWNLAEKSATMSIFLGKNILDQTDKNDFRIIKDSDEDDPLTKALKGSFNKEISDGEEKEE